MNFEPWHVRQNRTLKVPCENEEYWGWSKIKTPPVININWSELKTVPKGKFRLTETEILITDCNHDHTICKYIGDADTLEEAKEFAHEYLRDKSFLLHYISVYNDHASRVYVLTGQEGRWNGPIF